jgi:hypothetical protein
LEGLEVEHVGLFYGHWEYIKAVWYILWPMDKMLVLWFIFPHFGILYHEKSGNLDPNTLFTSTEAQRWLPSSSSSFPDSPPLFALAQGSGSLGLWLDPSPSVPS